jgi:hypothetical protein
MPRVISIPQSGGNTTKLDLIEAGRCRPPGNRWHATRRAPLSPSARPRNRLFSLPGWGGPLMTCEAGRLEA